MTRRKLDREIVLSRRRCPTGASSSAPTATSVPAIAIEPTRKSDTCVRPSDPVTLDPLAERVDPRASLEWGLRAAVYCARSDVGAVVDAHGPWATAWSRLCAPLLPELEEACYYGIGSARTAPYAPGASQKLAVGAAALGGSGAVLVARHGLVAVAETPALAPTIAEAVKHEAPIARLVRVGASAQLDAEGSRSRPSSRPPPKL